MLYLQMEMASSNGNLPSRGLTQLKALQTARWIWKFLSPLFHLLFWQKLYLTIIRYNNYLSCVVLYCAVVVESQMTNSLGKFISIYFGKIRIIFWWRQNKFHFNNFPRRSRIISSKARCFKLQKYFLAYSFSSIWEHSTPT